MARLPHGDGFAIRNSRHPDGPTLVFTPAEMTAFVAGVRDGDFDDLVAGSTPIDSDGIRAQPQTIQTRAM